jgi:hypothetical protein
VGLGWLGPGAAQRNRGRDAARETDQVGPGQGGGKGNALPHIQIPPIPAVGPVASSPQVRQLHKEPPFLGLRFTHQQAFNAAITGTLLNLLVRAPTSICDVGLTCSRWKRHLLPSNWVAVNIPAGERRFVLNEGDNSFSANSYRFSPDCRACSMRGNRVAATMRAGSCKEGVSWRWLRFNRHDHRPGEVV